jgi:hypothetical protein
VDIEADVSDFLKKLSLFVARAVKLGFHPPKPGWDYGTITGALPYEGVFDPQPLFAELMDCSVRTGRWGGFRLVSGVTFTQKGSEVTFEVDVLFASRRDEFHEHAKAAAQIAAYPLPVPGWGPCLRPVAEFPEI